MFAGSSADFEAFMVNETEKWSKVIRAANIWCRHEGIALLSFRAGGVPSGAGRPSAAEKSTTRSISTADFLSHVDQLG